MLSERYIQDRFLPDKAIDLMDEVGSRLNLTQTSSNAESLETRLQQVVQRKERAAEQENYEKAATLHSEEVCLRQNSKRHKNRAKSVSQ